jgi:hypothetical protein
VHVNGIVGGDVLVLGGMVTVEGSVEGSVRGAAMELDVRALVGEDLAVATTDLELEQPGAIGRNLVLAAGAAELEAAVAGDVEAWAGRVTANAEIGGNITGRISRLELDERGSVMGHIDIASPVDVARHSEAVVRGDIAVRPVDPGPSALTVAAWLWLRAMVGVFALAALRRAIAPGFSQRAVNALRIAPGRSAGLGVLSLLVAPAVAVAVAVMLVGLVLGGWWLGLFALAAFALAALLSYPLVAAVLGNGVLGVFSKNPSRSPLWDELVGLAILLGLTVIPVVGVLVALATVLFGLGAQLIALPGRWRLRTTARLDQRAETPFAGGLVGSAR